MKTMGFEAMSENIRPAVEVWDDAIAAWAADTIDTRQAAAAVIEADREAVRAPLLAEIERLREALGDVREETLWNAYNTGHVKDGLWSHLFMSDGEWLAQECGFDPTEYEYPDDEIRAAIPKVARAALAGDSQD